MAIGTFFSNDWRVIGGYQTLILVEDANNLGDYILEINNNGLEDNKLILPPQAIEDANNLGTNLESVNVTIQFTNTNALSYGELVLIPGETKLNFLFPSNSTGNFEVSSGRKTILNFRFFNNEIIWNSNIDSFTYTLSDTGIIDLYVDPNPVIGIDDNNHLTPYLTINHCIKQIQSKIPFTGGRPSQNSGYSGDRFLAVRINLNPGIYSLTPTEVDGNGDPIQSETVFAQYLNKYGIEFIGLGASPDETIIYGADSNSTVKLSGSHEINFKNLTFSSDQSGVYALDSTDVNIEDCVFVNRNANVRNAVYSYNSRITFEGTIELRGNFRRLINSNVCSICFVNAEVKLTPPTENPKPFEGFLSAFKASHVFADNMTVSDGVPQGGEAYALESPNSSIAMPTDIIGLTY